MYYNNCKQHGKQQSSTRSRGSCTGSQLSIISYPVTTMPQEVIYTNY